jgi:NADH-quinone oxidoreductase subunit C
MSEEHIAAQKLKEAFPEAVEDVSIFRGETTVLVRKEDLLAVGRFLKDEPDLAFDFLTLVCAVDRLPREPRFEMVYQLYSMQHRHRIRVKTRLGAEDLTVASVTSLWPTANWHEREAYDMMGIQFQDHPDLRRILLPANWEGYPLRKDYPLRGPDREA